MKQRQPVSFNIPKAKNRAILVQTDEAPFFYNQLHYHSEIQVTAILKGEGLMYAGNSMSTFTEMDVFVIGSNVPHLLKNSSIYYTENSPGVKGVSLFFNENSFGRQFFEIKELKAIKDLLNVSNRGIKIADKLGQVIHNKITGCTAVKNEELIINLLQILSLIDSAEKEFLNTAPYKLLLNENEGGRLNEVLDYTFQHFNTEINIEQIAKIACLSRSQFSYFFKLHTGKTYIQFLNELRIENACILLKKNNFKIEHICYEIGFKNVSNFVRQFKKIKSVTPSIYRKSWTVGD